MIRIISAIGLVVITLVVWPPLRPAVESMLAMAKGRTDFQDLIIDLVPYGVPAVAIIIAVLMIIAPMRQGGGGGGDIGSIQ